MSAEESIPPEPSGVTKATDRLKSGFSGLTSGFSNITSGLTNAANSATTGLTNAANSATTELTNATNSATSGLTNAASGLTDAASNLTPVIPDIPKIPGLDALPALPDGIPALPDGIPGLDALKDLPGLDALKDLPGLDALEGLPGMDLLKDSITTAFPAAGVALDVFNAVNSMIPVDVPIPEIDENTMKSELDKTVDDDKKDIVSLKPNTVFEKSKKIEVEHRKPFTCNINEKKEQDDNDKSESSNSNKTEASSADKTNMVTRIEQKIKCDHVKKLIVNKFVEFLDKKVLSAHFHSKGANSNYKKPITIFYRNGLSKIVSKITKDIETDPKVLDFFLEEIIEYILKLENKDFISFFEKNMEDDEILFDIMTNDRIMKYFQSKSENIEWTSQILLHVFSSSEFTELINLMDDSEMPKDDKQKWIDKYMEIQKLNEIRLEEKMEEESAYLQNFGIDAMLKSLGLNKPKTIKFVTEYVNANTDFSKKDGGNNRKTKKNKKKTKKVSK
jgi:hypothetical protein